MPDQARGVGILDHYPPQQEKQYKPGVPDKYDSCVFGHLTRVRGRTGILQAKEDVNMRKKGGGIFLSALRRSLIYSLLFGRSVTMTSDPGAGKTVLTHRFEQYQVCSGRVLALIFSIENVRLKRNTPI